MTISDFENEEVRKIQFSGKSSYMLALPKKWIEEMGLSAGEQVIVTREGDLSIVITPKKATSTNGKAEATIIVSQKDSFGTIVRKMIALYLVGYNIIHIRPKEGALLSAQRDTAKQTVRKNFIGTELIADSAQEITVQVLISFSELNIDNALRRMFLITSSMHKDALTALRKIDADLAQSVIKSDDEVDRFSLFIIRQLKMAVQNERILKETGLSSPRDCLGYRLIEKSVERVADHACKIAQGSLTVKGPINEQVLAGIAELSDHAVKVFEESGLALFKRDYYAADGVVEKSKLIADMEKKLLAVIEQNEPVDSIQTIRLIIESIRRTAEYASDIAEIVLNLTAEQIITNGTYSNSLYKK